MSSTVSGDPDHAASASARARAVHRYAPLPAADQVIAPLVDAAVHSLQSRAPRPQAVLLQGSCALGEACAFREADGAVTILSDLDLAVVVRDLAERDAWRAVARDWAREAAALPGSDRVLADWSLGVYALEDLPCQAPKMGTLELAESALVLAGDPHALASVVRHPSAAISEEEVLRLLAVRALELLAARAEWTALRANDAQDPGTPAGRAARRLAYAALKLIEDLGTALLSHAGAYVVGAARRAAALESAWRAHPALVVLAAREPWLPDAIAAATRARHAGFGWSEAAEIAGAGPAPFPDLVDRLDAVTVRPYTAVATSLLSRGVDARNGARHASFAAALGRAVERALEESAARPSTRAWLRLARRAGEMPGRIEILRLAAHHRFGPPPWLVAAGLAAMAVPGAASGADFDAVRPGAEALLGRGVPDADALATAALRTWALLA